MSLPVKRYIFADLDALSRNARACMQNRVREFSSQELAETWPLDPDKLTKFLSVTDGMVKLLRGCCCDLSKTDVESFQAAGWDVRVKGAPEHPTLENLLKRNLADDANGHWREDTKTLVLVGSELTDTILDNVEKYFDAGWRVQFYSFRAHGEIAVETLRSKHPSDFQNVFLDRFIGFLQKDEHATSLVDRSLKRVALKAAPKMQSLRFVFMDLDGINDMIFKSQGIYKKVPGAKGSWAIRINYCALTDLVSKGAESRRQRRMATFANTIPTLVHVLYQLGWATKKLSEEQTTMQVIDEFSLTKAASSAGINTLVLVMGTKALKGADKESWDRLLADFLSRQWRVEIFSWKDDFNTKCLRSLGDFSDQVTVRLLDDDAEKLLYLKATELSAVSASPGTPPRSLDTSASKLQHKKKNSSTYSKDGRYLDPRDSGGLASALLKEQESPPTTNGKAPTAGSHSKKRYRPRKPRSQRRKNQIAAQLEQEKRDQVEARWLLQEHEALDYFLNRHEVDARRRKGELDTLYRYTETPHPDRCCCSLM